MPTVPTVSNTMMQVTSFVLSGIACTLRLSRRHARFPFDGAFDRDDGNEESVGEDAPATGWLDSLLMAGR